MRTGVSNCLNRALLCAVAAMLIAGCGKKDDPIAQAGKKDVINGVSVPSIAETKAIAEEAFIYGLPIVMNYAVLYEFGVDRTRGQYKAPFNTLANDARVFTCEDTTVVTPNSDTPYSMVWLDLRAEPVVISVPAVAKSAVLLGSDCRWQHLQLRLHREPGAGIDAGTYLVTGPDWKGETPAGHQAGFPSTTPFALTIFRTQLFNAEDMPNVEKVQAGYKAQPLSAFLKQPAPPAAPKIDFLPATTAGIKTNSYEYLDTPLEFVPEDPEGTKRSAPSSPPLASDRERPSTSRIYRWSTKLQFLIALKEGDDKVDRFLSTGMKGVNGWKVGSFFGDRAFYNGDWLKRAAAAKGGIYGNDAVEAMYPMTRVDATGETLDASKHNYTLTFPGDNCRRSTPSGR